MNLLREGESADYINTGSWSKKAIKEAQIIGAAKIAGSSEEEKFTKIPKQDELTLDPNADAYVKRIFGANNYTIVDHVARLPEKLPALFASLTR